MQLIDLTLAIPRTERQKPMPDAPLAGVQTVRTSEWHLGEGESAYTARVHFFSHWGMAGTYIDFPGHIIETDDGDDAATVPASKLFRLHADVIRLDRESGSGAVEARELAAAHPDATQGDALIVNALGTRRFDEVEERSVYLTQGAVQWIIDTGIHVLVSDIYESNTNPQGVFTDLFAHGVYTVCCPINLHQLTKPSVRLTVLPLRFSDATQLPCRIIAEQEEA